MSKRGDMAGAYYPHWCRECHKVIEDECFHCHVAEHDQARRLALRSNGPEDHEERCYLAGYGEDF